MLSMIAFLMLYKLLAYLKIFPTFGTIVGWEDRDPHENSKQRRDPRSIVVAEAKPNNIVYFVYTLPAVYTVELINT